MHWAQQYIGCPWVSGARGPLAFDCYGLLYHIYRHHYGVELPEFPGIDASDHRAVLRHMRQQEEVKDCSWPDWVHTHTPLDGCAVVMGGAELLHHVGIFFSTPEGGLILHCRAGRGVVAQTIRELRQAGFGRIAFYRHAAIR